jgi:hypothetical protein
MDQGMKSAQPGGNADKHSVTVMLPHHQRAVDMAKVELQYGKDPEQRELAENIIKAQDDEIAQIKAWLAKHGQRANTDRQATGAEASQFGRPVTQDSRRVVWPHTGTP